MKELETIKEKLITKSKTLGVGALGITAFPLSSDHVEHVSETVPCPFTSGQGSERLHGNCDSRLYKRAIVCLFPYKTYGYEGPINLARYTWGQDYHLVVRDVLQQMGTYLQELVPSSHYDVHVDTSPLSNRYYAYMAGLGFYGKNHCFIHPTLGSYVNIGILLTSLELPEDESLQESCLGCNRCIDTCPGQVLGKDRFYFEHCKSYLTQKKGELTPEEQTIIGKTDLIFGCDQCQEVCPHNEGVPGTLLEAFQSVQPYVSPDELEEMTNRQFKEAYGHRAFSWRGKRILLRNAQYIDAYKERHTKKDL